MTTPQAPAVLCSICNVKFADRQNWWDHRRTTGTDVYCVRPDNDYVLDWHLIDGAWENYGVLQIVETRDILEFLGGE